jgi:hypothetical protein
MVEALVLVSAPPLIGLLGLILKLIVDLRDDNRKDHGTVVKKLDFLAEGHDELRADIRDVKADVRDLKSDHRQLDRELGSLQSLIGVPDE